MKEVASNFLHTIHVVPRCRSPNPCLPQQQDTIPHAVKISVLRPWRWAKDCPKHVELILEINKLLLLQLVGSFTLLYLHRWCTVKHKSSLQIKLFKVFRKCIQSIPPLLLSDFNSSQHKRSRNSFQLAETAEKNNRNGFHPKCGTVNTGG